MRHIVVANNKDISKKHVEKLNIQKEDILYFFNFLKPFEHFENVENAVYMSRKRASFEKRKKEGDNNFFPYAGMEKFSTIQSHFSKVVFYPYPNNLFMSYIDRISIDKSKMFKLSLNKKLQNPKIKNYSSGLMMYCYIRENKKRKDKIVLFGFTSKVAKQFHDPDKERSFFTQEIETGNCEALFCYDGFSLSTIKKNDNNEKPQKLLKNTQRFIKDLFGQNISNYLEINQNNIAFNEFKNTNNKKIIFLSSASHINNVLGKYLAFIIPKNNINNMNQIKKYCNKVLVDEYYYYGFFDKQ
jgi:hypothetical protein